MSFILCAEDQQSKNNPQERARSRIQIYCRFTLRTGSIGRSSPLPRTTRHSNPSSNPKRHLGHIWCDLRTPSIRLNKMVWFTGFPVNADKSTSGKQGDLCMRESKTTTGKNNSPIPRPPPFLSTPITSTAIAE